MLFASVPLEAADRAKPKSSSGLAELFPKCCILTFADAENGGATGSPINGFQIELELLKPMDQL